MWTRRHCYGIPWTVPAIRSHDQGRFQLLACGGFPKTVQTSISDRWCLRVSDFLPPFRYVFTMTRRWSRHPSYAGFFYWALGTQLVLQNPLSFCVYSVLLMRFFSSRIRGEPYLPFVFISYSGSWQLKNVHWSLSSAMLTCHIESESRLGYLSYHRTSCRTLLTRLNYP
jgi:hypothetical protein